MKKYKIGIITSLLIIVPSVFLYPFGKNRVTYESCDWKVLRSVHFDIHYLRGMDKLAVATAGIAEQGYLRIASYLSHELTDPVSIIVFPSNVAFQNNNIIPDTIGEGAGGFTEAFRTRVVLPFTGNFEEFRYVLIHELVHAFQFNILFSDISGARMSKLSFRGAPLWFVKGMAEYISAGFDEECGMVIRDALFNDYFVSLQDLSTFRTPNLSLLYKQGQSFMYFLEEEYGGRIIGDIFRDIRDTGSFEKAIEINTGKNIRSINTEWKRFFQRRYYPLISDKDFSDETGRVLTVREDYSRSLNLSPAVSPDGKKIAYISDRDIFPSVLIENLRNEKKRSSVKKIVRSGRRADFETLNTRRNSLNWSPDGETLVFAARFSGSDAIYFVGAKSGKIKKRIIVPLRSVSYPGLSFDGSMIVFCGATASGTDLYIYYVEENRLKRLTDDDYVQRNPVFSRDGESIIFSSNGVPGFADGNGGFNIYKLDIKSGAVDPLISDYSNAIQPSLSSDGGKMLFVSDMTGISNVYVYEFASGAINMVTDLISGAFNPVWFPSGNEIAFVAYRNAGYDIIKKKIDPDSFREPQTRADIEYVSHEYIPQYVNPADLIFDEYRPRPSADTLFFGVAGAFSYGLLGFAQVSFSDDLAIHKFTVDTSYIRYESTDDFNVNMRYLYRKHRWDFGVGAFRRKNPFFFYSLENINDLIHNIHEATVYMNHYGAYLLASYPFSRFLRTDIKTTVSRYERDYSANMPRPDVRANLNQVSVAMVYDNVHWGTMVPLRGFRGRVEYEQAFNITGSDYIYSSFDIDMRRYFLLGNNNVFALRGIGGKLLGPDSEHFEYYIGGYNTVRGHKFLKYGGENMVLLSCEYRFHFIEGLKLGWPFPLQLGSIGGVLFLDTGAAWSDSFTIVDEDTGRWEAMMAGFGFGLRMVLYPLIVLKLDYSWPFDNEGIGERDIIISIGTDF